ncbi:MAG: DUF5684 domain-containing protein [Candidatus Moranbacteria bacterium]|nr:DUF5684 domain-containing protein [Candidatus Moranbacteria bacterium]
MNQTNIPTEAVLPIAVGIITFIVLFLLAYYIYMSVCLMKIAKKTNTQNAWFAWIPILDMLLALQIAKKPTWWIVWFFIPLANLIVYILVWMGICKILQKAEWLGILMIISPLNLLIPGYLAFSKTAVISDKPRMQIVNVSL